MALESILLVVSTYLVISQHPPDSPGAAATIPTQNPNGASINRGPQNRPQYIMGLIIGTTKMGPPISRKSQMNFISGGLWIRRALIPARTDGQVSGKHGTLKRDFKHLPIELFLSDGGKKATPGSVRSELHESQNAILPAPPSLGPHLRHGK